MPMLEGVPALIYALFWPYRLDGRLKYVAKDEHLRVLFDFIDFPPAALLIIKNGDFEVNAIDTSLALEAPSADVIIRGSFKYTTEMLGNLRSALKVIVLRKIKVKHKIRALRLIKILSIKHIKNSEEI